MRQQAYALAMGKKEGAHIMGASNETDKTREQTAKEPENASHLPDKLVA